MRSRWSIGIVCHGVDGHGGEIAAETGSHRCSEADYMVLEVKTCQCRADIVANVDPNQCGAVVTFASPVFTDACDNHPTVTCTPASGSFFPVGSTSVTCTATDQSGNQGRCSLALRTKPV